MEMCYVFIPAILWIFLYINYISVNTKHIHIHIHKHIKWCRKWNWYDLVECDNQGMWINSNFQISGYEKESSSLCNGDAPLTWQLARIPAYGLFNLKMNLLKARMNCRECFWGKKTYGRLEQGNHCQSHGLIAEDLQPHQ